MTNYTKKFTEILNESGDLCSKEVPIVVQDGNVYYLTESGGTDYVSISAVRGRTHGIDAVKSQLEASLNDEMRHEGREFPAFHLSRLIDVCAAIAAAAEDCRRM